LQGRPSLVEIPKGITHADLRSRLCEALRASIPAPRLGPLDRRLTLDPGLP
jgi:hypothetical protein